jgi:hypothetical protein
MGKHAAKFLDVRHAEIRELGATKALALAASRYRSALDRDTTPSLLAAWLGWSRTTAWRQLCELKARGAVDERGRPYELELDGPAGFVRVPLRDGRMQLGDLEAVAISLLGTWGTLRTVRSVGGWSQARLTQFSKFLGCCTKTASQVLKRLASGRGIRAVRAAGARLRPWIRLRGRLGAAAQVLVLGERQRQQAATPAPRQETSVAERLHCPPPDLGSLLEQVAACTRV